MPPLLQLIYYTNYTKNPLNSLMNQLKCIRGHIIMIYNNPFSSLSELVPPISYARIFNYDDCVSSYRNLG